MLGFLSNRAYKFCCLLLLRAAKGRAKTGFNLLVYSVGGTDFALLRHTVKGSLHRTCRDRVSLEIYQLQQVTKMLDNYRVTKMVRQIVFAG